MDRYHVYLDGRYVGSAATKQLAQALLLELGESLKPGSKVSFQVKLGKEVVGEGGLEIDALN
ncbi:hypothetical protein ACUXQ2_004055 [Cupriavidus metallidurans]|nr:hypothetical protein [Cupriavidus sp.]